MIDDKLMLQPAPKFKDEDVPPTRDFSNFVKFFLGATVRTEKPVNCAECRTIKQRDETHCSNCGAPFVYTHTFGC